MFKDIRDKTIIDEFYSLKDTEPKKQFSLGQNCIFSEYENLLSRLLYLMLRNNLSRGAPDKFKLLTVLFETFLVDVSKYLIISRDIILPEQLNVPKDKYTLYKISLYYLKILARICLIIRLSYFPRGFTSLSTNSSVALLSLLNNNEFSELRRLMFFFITYSQAVVPFPLSTHFPEIGSQKLTLGNLVEFCIIDLIPTVDEKDLGFDYAQSELFKKPYEVFYYKNLIAKPIVGLPIRAEDICSFPHNK